VGLAVTVEVARSRTSWRRADNFANRARRIAHEIQLACAIDAERADVAEAAAQLRGVFDDVRKVRFAGNRVNNQRQRPHTASYEIREEVPAAMARSEAEAPVYVTARDRLANIAAVLVYRINQRGIGRRRHRDVVVRSFAIAPTVVSSAAVWGFVVDLFELSLTDIANEKSSGSASGRIVEAVAPGVPQAKSPDLGAGLGRARAYEGVARRYLLAARMAVRHVHVNPQHFSEELSRTLGTITRVVCGPAAAKTDVEEPIRAERKVSAIVIGEWLRDERRSSGSTPMQIEPTTTGLADLTKRATTVFPARSVKLTKNRPLVA